MDATQLTTVKPVDFIRLSHDLFFVRSHAAIDQAVSMFHAGRNFGDGKAYKVSHNVHFSVPAVIALDMDIDRNFRVEIRVTGQHLPDLVETMFGGALSPAQKIAVIEQQLGVDLLH